MFKIIGLSYTGDDNEEYDASDILSRGGQLAEESRLKNARIDDIIADRLTDRLGPATLNDTYRIREKLQQLIDLAAWAISHDYKKIYFA